MNRTITIRVNEMEHTYIAVLIIASSVAIELLMSLLVVHRMGFPGLVGIMKVARCIKVKKALARYVVIPALIVYFAPEYIIPYSLLLLAIVILVLPVVIATAPRLASNKK